VTKTSRHAYPSDLYLCSTNYQHGYITQRGEKQREAPTWAGKLASYTCFGCTQDQY